MSVLDTLLGVVAPHSCLGCLAEGSLLCPACARLLPGTSPIALDTGTAYSVSPYGDTAKNLIWKLKSSGAQAAARLMALLMAEQLPTGDYLVVPIPTATSRVRQRGYDQARLLARALARQLRCPYSDCLVRIGQAHQVGANRQQRLKQLHDAYRLKNMTSVSGKVILLVDDVMTTGASLEAASKLLIKAGAQTVDAITFARA
jgi:competence protein ComFC